MIVIGRDQVSLRRGLCAARICDLALVLRAGRLARIRASVVPLLAGAVIGALIVSVPVLLTELLADNSNRPEIGYALPAAARCIRPIC